MATINQINNTLNDPTVNNGIFNMPTITAPIVSSGIFDTNNNEVLKITATASAVNELTLTNAATGGSPTLSATGGDTNIGITITPKGTGLITLGGSAMNINSSGHVVSNMILNGTGTAVHYTYYSNTGVNAFLGIEGSAGAQILGGTSPYSFIFGTETNDPVEICTTSAPRIRLAGGGTITVCSSINYAADAQASDTYVITLDPALTAYVTGQQVIFKANTANTGAASININGLGAKTIVKRVNTTLANSDILAGMFCHIVYDGTNFVLLNPVVN